MSLSLILGGTRSGKSARGERLAAGSGLPVRYVATADSSDASMTARIQAHRVRRPPDWSTVDAADDLAACLDDGATASCVLIDGLGAWIAGVMHRAGAFAADSADALAAVDRRVREQADRLTEAAASMSIIVVAEEAGQGLLPPDAASRAWLDLLGTMTQRLSAAADRVELVVAGRPLLISAPAAAPPQLRHHGDRDVRPSDADHAVNVLAGGPPPWLADALTEVLPDALSRYPDETEAMIALAALHGRDPVEIVPTNGGVEALWLLPAALRPQLAVCVHPAFTEAEAALHAHGVAVTRVLRDPAHGFALDPRAVPEAADLVIVGNPASPSGTLDPAGAVLALRRPGRTLVVDEAFMSLVPGEPGSLARERLDDVIVVRSLTKSLALPGLRVGYAIAGAALARRLRAVRPPWSANALALTALAVAAGRPAELAAAAHRADAERADLCERLDAVPGLRTWTSVTNFCLVAVPDGPAVVSALRARGIAVRPAASFPGLGPSHLRLTARDPVANARLVEELTQAMGS